MLATLSLNVPPIRVSNQFILALPEGRELVAFGIRGSGTIVTGPDKKFTAGIGWVFRDEGGKYYIMTQEGLRTSGPVYALLRLARDNKSDPRPISADDVRGNLVRGQAIEPDGFPTQMPVLRNGADSAAAVCTVFNKNSLGRNETTLAMYPVLPDALRLPAISVRQGPQDVVATAIQVVIPGGRGAIVRSLPNPESQTSVGTIYLIADDGKRYSLPLAASTQEVDAMVALGYGGVTPVDVPDSMLQLLPFGVNLDASAARKEVQPGNSSNTPLAPLPNASPSTSPSPSAQP